MEDPSLRTELLAREMVVGVMSDVSMVSTAAGMEKKDRVSDLRRAARTDLRTHAKSVSSRFFDGVACLLVLGLRDGG